MNAASPAAFDLSQLKSTRRAARGVRSLALVITLSVPLVGCATKSDVRDLQDEVRELYSQQQVLLQQLQTAQRGHNDAISEVARNLQDGRAETARRMSNIEDQLLTIQELAGLSQQQVASLRDQLQRDRTEGRFGPPQAFGPSGGGGDQAVELYEAALTQLQRGTLSAARMGFRQILGQFGSHDLAPEARYYLAEILGREDNTEEAIAAFLEIQEFHPTAPRVPDALYRAGLLHLDLENPDDAEQLFDRVVNTWPDSMAADLARNELRDL